MGLVSTGPSYKQIIMSHKGNNETAEYLLESGKWIDYPEKDDAFFRAHFGEMWDVLCKECMGEGKIVDENGEEKKCICKKLDEAEAEGETYRENQ